ncbi:hypothetical protein [Stappia sp. 28M-7]|uniref:hypothetical protein n=1 Tax=Stappia sp. 28M-7 TaxID=2762596 RepID=UPI000FEF5360|nr:hypothetical protein [Stappia sp. 28M-7]
MKTVRMLAAIAALALGTAATPVLAADATEPVRAVMAAAEANWADPPQDFQDYFSEERLASLYSADLAARYRKAADTPSAKEMGTPLDWDVVVNAQDGCPLQDVSIAPAGQENGATRVVARFRALTCFGSEAEYQGFQEAHFLVIEEGGRAVIDDIVTPMDGEAQSLKDQLDIIAAEAG